MHVTVLTVMGKGGSSGLKSVFSLFNYFLYVSILLGLTFVLFFSASYSLPIVKINAHKPDTNSNSQQTLMGLPEVLTSGNV